MQVAAQINQTLLEILPAYGAAYNFAQLQVAQSMDSLSKLYQGSSERISKARKVSNRFTKQASWLLSESAEELIDLIEYKLKIVNDDTSEHDKTARILKILSQLKETYLVSNLKKAIEYKGAALVWSKQQSDKYILPLYFTLKATIIVSSQIMMETLAERLGQLKMRYEVSKDNVTMMFAGEFDEQKIMKRVSTNIDSFKQFTISFVKKGMEIQISKKDLHLNFTTVSDKLVEIVKGVSEKSKEQWVQAKTKTMSLYKSVLTRIKEKEVLIRTEYSSKKTEVKPIKTETTETQK